MISALTRAFLLPRQSISSNTQPQSELLADFHAEAIEFVAVEIPALKCSTSVTEGEYQGRRKYKFRKRVLTSHMGPLYNPDLDSTAYPWSFLYKDAQTGMLCV